MDYLRKLTVVFSLMGLIGGQYEHPFDTRSHCMDNWANANSKCYKFVTDEVVTFQEAVTECQKQQSTLLVIDNQDDLTFLSDEVDVYPSDGFWTSLVREENYWYWKDLYAPDMTLITWNQEPDNSNGKQNCGAVNVQLTFSDEDCNLKLGFICEMPQKTAAPSDEGPCSEGWVIGNTNKCYYISSPDDPTELLTWTDAEANCKYKDDGSMIVSMRDQELQTLYLVLPEQPLGTAKWWTSLNRQNGDLYWGIQYADSTKIKWDLEPNNLGGGENCGVLSMNGKFSDVDCTKERNYICQKNDDTVPQNPALGIFGCTTPWMRAGHKCYYFQDYYRSEWQSARDDCIGAGGDLLKVESADERTWMKYMLGSTEWRAYWAGLNDQSKEGEWRWADGTIANPALVNWNQEPNDMGGRQDCAVMMPDGVFDDVSCDNKAGFICEATAEDSPCPENWLTTGEETCYFFQPDNGANTSVTWLEAKDRCRDLALPADGFLVSIGDSTDREFVTQQVMSFGVDSTRFWTGLNDRFDEGVWHYDAEYANPPNMDLVQWNGEPNGGPQANCALITSGGRYDDQNCNYKHNFVCEKLFAGGPSLPTNSTNAGNTRHQSKTAVVLLTLSLTMRLYFGTVLAL